MKYFLMILISAVVLVSCKSPMNDTTENQTIQIGKTVKVSLLVDWGKSSRNISVTESEIEWIDVGMSPGDNISYENYHVKNGEQRRILFDVEVDKEYLLVVSYPNGIAEVKTIKPEVGKSIDIVINPSTIKTSVDWSIEPFQVNSPYSQGMRIINVPFSEELDKESAETVENYIPKNNKYSEITVKSAKLLPDEKTVQLFLAAGLYNDMIEDCIEVKNVRNKSKQAMVNTTTKVLTVYDSSVPSVVALEPLSNLGAVITFSEAVQDFSLSSFRLDDKDIIKEITYPFGGDYTKIFVEFESAQTIAAHTLVIGVNNSISDFNVTGDGTANFNILQSAGYVLNISEIAQQ